MLRISAFSSQCICVFVTVLKINNDWSFVTRICRLVLCIKVLPIGRRLTYSRLLLQEWCNYLREITNESIQRQWVWILLCSCKVGLERHSGWQSPCSNLIASFKKGRKICRARVWGDQTKQFAWIHDANILHEKTCSECLDFVHRRNELIFYVKISFLLFGDFNCRVTESV